MLNDFLSPRFLKRLQHHELQQDPLIRALGLHKNAHQTVIDATAGHGQDSLRIAATGAKVILFERETSLFAQLDQTLTTLAEHPNFLKIIANMQWHHADFTHQDDYQHCIDVVYLDPMFPQRGKSALPKKAMQTIQGIASHEESGDQLWQAALRHQPTRIVIKRPRKGPGLVDQKPSFQILGKAIRFDGYISPVQIF